MFLFSLKRVSSLSFYIILFDLDFQSRSYRCRDAYLVGMPLKLVHAHIAWTTLLKVMIYEAIFIFSMSSTRRVCLRCEDTKVKSIYITSCSTLIFFFGRRQLCGGIQGLFQHPILHYTETLAASPGIFNKSTKDESAVRAVMLVELPHFL